MIFLPIELTKRGAEATLFLAKELTKRGYTSLVGDSVLLLSLAFNIASEKDVYIDTSMADCEIRNRLYNKFNQINALVYSTDAEGILMKEISEFYEYRFPASNCNKVSKILLWGSRDENEILKRFPDL